MDPNSVPKRGVYYELDQSIKISIERCLVIQDNTILEVVTQVARASGENGPQTVSRSFKYRPEATNVADKTLDYGNR